MDASCTRIVPRYAFESGSKLSFELCVSSRGVNLTNSENEATVEYSIPVLGNQPVAQDALMETLRTASQDFDLYSAALRTQEGPLRKLQGDSSTGEPLCF
jgi:hypothetical protein